MAEDTEIQRTTDGLIDPMDMSEQINPPSKESEDSEASAAEKSEDAEVEKEQTSQVQPEGQGKEEKASEQKKEDTVPRSYVTKLEQINSDVQKKVDYLTGVIETLMQQNSTSEQSTQKAQPEPDFFENLSEQLAEDPDSFGKNLKSYLEGFKKSVKDEFVNSDEYRTFQQSQQEQVMERTLTDMLSKYDDSDKYSKDITEYLAERIGDIKKLTPEQAQNKLAWMFGGGVDDAYAFAKLKAEYAQKAGEISGEVKKQTGKVANLGSGGDLKTGSGTAANSENTEEEQVDTRVGKMDKYSSEFAFDNARMASLSRG
jgi:hypothetical protein